MIVLSFTVLVLGSELIDQLLKSLGKTTSFIEAESDRETRISMVDVDNYALSCSANCMTHDKIRCS